MRILALVSIAAVAASPAMAQNVLSDRLCVAAAAEKIPQIPSLQITNVDVQKPSPKEWRNFPYGMLLVSVD